MSLTAFQRIRRMQQKEEMKPENIKPEVKEIKFEEKPVEEETKITSTNRRRNTSKRK